MILLSLPIPLSLPFHLPLPFPLSLVSTQLQQVALRLVKESFGDVMYSKAMDCIKTLRKEMISVSFNEKTHYFIYIF